MAWTPQNIQYTTNGLSGSTLQVVNPVGRDNGDYCGLLLKARAQGGVLNQQLTIQEAAICRPCLRQIEQRCPRPGKGFPVSAKVKRQRVLLANAQASNPLMG